MNRAAGNLFRTDPSLQEYYDACAEDTEDEGDASGVESDDNSSCRRRSTRCSPLSGKARLKLYQRDSVQKLMRDQERVTRRGHDAELTVSVLSRPLVVASESQGTAHAPQLLHASLTSCAKGSSHLPTSEESLIFDALCTLYQSPNGNFVSSYDREGVSSSNGPVTWLLKRSVALTEAWKGISFSAQALIGAILVGSNDVARANWQLDVLCKSLSKEDISLMDDAFNDYSVISTGDEALPLASHLVLHRVRGIVRGIIHNISKFAMQLQEEEQKQLTRGNVSTFTPQNRVRIQQDIDQILLPLRRCIHIMEHGCRLVEGVEGEGNPEDAEDEIDSIARASGLMDYLIVRMSALQDSSTMDLYRFYMVFLVYCSWPYVQLMTSAIFGFVTNIDAEVWRSRIPRIFRLSFSHIRVEEDHRRGARTTMLPTDILSLVFLCIGHERAEGKGCVSRCEESCEDRLSIQQLRRAERRAVFGLMMSSRSFILHSFVAFVRQKTLKGWRRKRAYGHCDAACDVLSLEGELQRFERINTSSDGVVADVVPLELCCECARPSDSSRELTMCWKLQIENNKTHHDIVLCEDRNEEGVVSGGSAKLWLHLFLPAARWVTVSLLIPIAQVVQQLQKRRLSELLSVATTRLHVSSSLIAGFDERNDAVDVAATHKEVGAVGDVSSSIFMNLEPIYSGNTDAPRASVSNVSFHDFVSLFIDIALCRDTERVVYTFLYRLFNESHWWYRGGAAEHACSGTASSFISSAFADAMREHKLGQFVRLSVRPKTDVVAEHDTSNGEKTCVEHPVEMLRTFAAFELVFTLPADVEVILLPQSLSVEWDRNGEIHEKQISHFWRRRRNSDASLPRPPGGGEIPPRDCWSYCFGYLCSLHYAQISLREQRKRLQRHHLNEYNNEAAYASGNQRAVRVVRGLGSAYFELSFAVDCLLSFSKNVVTSVVCKLEDLTKAGSADSCITLCQKLDALLLRLLAVCFPEVERSGRVGVAAAGSITDSVTALLTIALDPAGLPMRRVMSRTRSAVEALVAVVRTLPATSVIKKHVKALLVLLTFNRFYGE
uniref:Uncharacterized protein n=1 Tax=Trypanosoma congolense (strain IL3000) TaxID=1068625 RepID=G0UZW3_TRYCI|nr:conserved hypothetical protein [Trypanosoma congolense IL3000]